MSDTIRFQHFEVLRREDGSPCELGHGAMGITYKAFDTNLRCFVALKVINAAYLNSEVARQRFLREARAAAALRHPNVATVFHLGSEGDDYFYAMEYVDGETVEAFMKREGAVPPLMALEIASQVSRALGAAQKQGLVHRDIKPANLMLVHEDDSEFTVKVIDFGLAKNSGKDGGEDTATLTMGGFLGTPHFASPEQLDEKEVDVRSDIYSLGVTLWFMLSGRTPFAGSLAQVMSQHLHREPPFASLESQPAEVVTLLRRMMAKEPVERPQTPGDLRRELEACIEAIKGRPLPLQGKAPLSNPDAFETKTMDSQEAGSFAEPSTGLLLAGRYRLLEEKISTDLGRTFRAESTEDGRSVAVVILAPALLPNRETFTRLENDVKTIQAIPAPAIQQIKSLERVEQGSFLVMEWVDGPLLLELLRARKALPLGEARLILDGLAQALDALSAAKLPCPNLAVHEIILAGGNCAQPVTSWGAFCPKFNAIPLEGEAVASPDMTLVTTPFSSMKESGVFEKNPTSAAVYVLAALANEMLGGVRMGSTESEFVPIPGVSEPGNAALRRALNPDLSFPSAKDFLQALGSDDQPARLVAPLEVRQEEVATVRSNPTQSPVSSPKAIPAGVIAAIIAVVVILGSLTIWIGWKFISSPKSASESQEASTPQPTPAALVQETPVATPAPAATPLSDYDRSLAEAQALMDKDDNAGALVAAAALSRKYPTEKHPLDMMEMIAAKLRSNAIKLKPGDAVALRKPLEAAADLNVISAQMLLGDLLLESESSTSLKWFMAAANQGQSEAMILIGQMLASGRGIATPDLKEATVWFSKAAESGEATGMYLFAECLFYGKGIPKDPKRAVEMLSTATALNHARSMNMLGDLYRKGIPGQLEPNPNESFRLFTKAKELGSKDSYGYLGVLYMLGEGVPQVDEKKAASLFLEGAEMGNPLSMAFYAQCLLAGRGIDKDPEAARSWYKRAAEAGNRGAIDWCKENGVSVTPSRSPLLKME